VQPVIYTEAISRLDRIDRTFERFQRRIESILIDAYVAMTFPTPLPDPDLPSVEGVGRPNETGNGGASKLPGVQRPDLVSRKKSPRKKSAARGFRQNFNKSRQCGNWPAVEAERALSVQMDALRTQYRAKICSRRSLDEHVRAKEKAVRSSRLRVVSS